MASINAKVKAKTETTHGGATVKIPNAEEQLRRSVMANLLWEGTFYEEGEDIATRIKTLIPSVPPMKVAEIAIEARQLMHMRHVPLLIVREMARLDTHKDFVARTLDQVIQRADELTEFLAIYWADGKQKLSAQVKKGLAQAFTKFSAYDLAKYNRDEKSVKLKDVLFLCHAKPTDGIKGFTKAKRARKNAKWPQDEGSTLFKKLIDGTLESPDTWEVQLSAGKDKRETWTRLLMEKKLGGLALIRNLRNMEQVSVDSQLISESLLNMKTDRILPFRFLTAAKHAPRFEPQLEQAMFKASASKPKLKGKTVVIIDVSGSMYGSRLSKKSEVDRAEGACALASLAREQCENAVIYATAGNDSTRVHKTQLVPARRGMALSQAIYAMSAPLGGGGIFLKQVMDYVAKQEQDVARVIVVTDEQDCSHGSADSPDKAQIIGKTGNYIINVSTDKAGIGYGKWTKISGWSDAVLDYIRVFEEGPDHAESGKQKANRRTSKSLQ
jgi:60 kDa SS-A/Ro ribonucleoprotein